MCVCVGECVLQKKEEKKEGLMVFVSVVGVGEGDSNTILLLQLTI